MRASACDIHTLDPRLITSTVLPVLSEIVTGAPTTLPGELGYQPVRRAVLQSVSQPRYTMTEIEVTRKIGFNPARVEDYITDLTIEFDSAPAGRYDDRAKLGSIAKRIDNPGLLAFARDWIRNGIPTARGGRIDWQSATWAQAKDALRLTYAAPDEAEQSAKILDDFTQTERTSQHSTNWLRHREQAGAVIDLDSESLLVKKAYSSILSIYLPPSCRKHDLESIQFEIDELIALGQLKHMKHVMVHQTLEKCEGTRSTGRCCRILGSSYKQQNYQTNQSCYYQTNQSCYSRFISR